MQRPTYYALDEDGYLVGTRLAQLDPRETKLAGEDVWMAPGRNDAKLPAPPEPGANKVLRWVDDAWTVEDDFRGETWYADWETEQVVDKPGTPQGLSRTREDLPEEKLREYVDKRLFNWAYYEKHGDHKPLVVDGVELWSDALSLTQVLLENEHARNTPGYKNDKGWKGRNGTLPTQTPQDVQKIVGAYRQRQADVHDQAAAKREALANASSRAEVLAMAQAIYSDLVATGEWE